MFSRNWPVTSERLNIILSGFIIEVLILFSNTSDEKPTKGSFLFSIPTQILYISTSLILTCMLIPQVYLASKHKKLHTLNAAVIL